MFWFCADLEQTVARFKADDKNIGIIDMHKPNQAGLCIIIYSIDPIIQILLDREGYIQRNWTTVVCRNISCMHWISWNSYNFV